MNPPEQAPALKQIFEARLELVRQNEAEVEDLKHRLKQASRRGKELVAQMKVAKANYEEATSKIVDLMEDGDGDEDEKYGPGMGNESKYSRDATRKTSKKRGKPTPDESSQSHNEGAEPHVKLERRSTPTISSQLQEIVELLESDDENEIESSTSEGKRKASHSTKRPRSSSSGSANPEKESLTTSKRSKSSSPSDKSGNKSNRSDEKESSSTRRARSSSTSSAGKTAEVTRKRSPSVSFSNRIKLRPRPSSIPPESWLKSSVGRTREELNSIDDMVQYMGSCQFGKSVILSQFGKVYAIILNDEWNTLAQRNDEYQFWYVGLGPGRKRDARLVGASESSIPIFHAPKEQYSTKELFYVGHYKVKKLEELETPVIEMEKERDMKITFVFEKFDERLDSIIKRGPDR